MPDETPTAKNLVDLCNAVKDQGSKTRLWKYFSTCNPTGFTSESDFRAYRDNLQILLHETSDKEERLWIKDCRESMAANLKEWRQMNQNDFVDRATAKLTELQGLLDTLLATIDRRMDKKEKKALLEEWKLEQLARK
jgi:hypothetical protein